MTLVRKSLCLAVLVCAAAASVAFAATINGTNGDDVLIGTNSADKGDAMAGDDIMWGQRGNDTLQGGGDDDDLYGDGECPHGGGYCDSGEDNDPDDGDGIDGDDNLKGGDGNDRIFGQGGKDAINGSDGADTVNGGSGVDDINGGDGNDDLTGGPGADKVSGGLNSTSGNDTLRVRDGVSDTISACGPGSDTVYADPLPKDPTPSDCETVLRASYVP